MPSGARIAVTVQLSSSPSPNRSSPSALRALLHGSGERPVPSHRRVHAVLEVQLERGVESLHHADRRRPRVLGVGQRGELPVDHPVEVEPRVRRGLRGRLPRAVADGHERDTGRGGQRLLRPADRDVDPPPVERRTARRRGEHTTSTTTKAPASFATWRAARWAGSRRSRSRDCVSSTALTGCSASAPRPPRDRIFVAPLVLDGPHGQPEGLREALPPLGEEPRERDEHLVAGREAVLDRGLEAARAGWTSSAGCPRPVGPVELPQPVGDVAHQLPEARDRGGRRAGCPAPAAPRAGSGSGRGPG